MGRPRKVSGIELLNAVEAFFKEHGRYPRPIELAKFLDVDVRSIRYYADGFVVRIVLKVPEGGAKKIAYIVPAFIFPEDILNFLASKLISSLFALLFSFVSIFSYFNSPFFSSKSIRLGLTISNLFPRCYCYLLLASHPTK